MGRFVGIALTMPFPNGVINMEPLTLTIAELMVSTLATGDALTKLLIDKGLITEQELLQRIAQEQAVYQRLLNPKRQ